MLVQSLYFAQFHIFSVFVCVNISFLETNLPVHPFSFPHIYRRVGQVEPRGTLVQSLYFAQFYIFSVFLVNISFLDTLIYRYIHFPVRIYIIFMVKPQGEAEK